MKSFSFLLSSIRRSTALVALALWLGGAGSAFAAGPLVLRVAVTALNGGGTDTLTLDDARLNGKPTAKLIVMHNFGTVGARHNSPVGVQYIGAPVNRWRLVNENGALMKVEGDNSFNVLVSSAAARILASPANSDGARCFFTAKKGKPDARFLVTHVINPLPKKSNGTRLEDHLGVIYTSLLGTPTNNVWSVLSEEINPMVATAFNVLDVTTAVRSFVHTATALNITNNFTAISDPIADGNPNAIVFATHVVNPPGAATNFLAKAIGVFYLGGKWRIYLEDPIALPVNTTFNVAVFAAATP